MHEETAQITLQIDSYHSIFSDFDPRPFAQRALSSDFLDEMKRASSDKSEGKIELCFLMRGARNIAEENTIVRRLKAHFERHHKESEKEKDAIILKGMLFSAVGIVFMFLTTLLLFRYEHSTLLASLFIVVLEPAGWFSFWEGLNHIFFESKSVYPALSFYKKMRTATITFTTKGTRAKD
jgi:hypothetical protein